ncbi:MAG: hypothetical protein WCO31_01530 [Actinomycetes bacterium]
MKKFAWAASALVLAAVLVGAVGIGFSAQTYQPPAGVVIARDLGTTNFHGKSYHHVSLDLSTYPDSSGVQPDGKPIHPGGNPSWPAYGPSNLFQVPANSYVTMTIKQYDSGEPLNNPWFATVAGTVDGTATIDGKRVHQISADHIGHTFTMRGLPGVGSKFFLNVPLPPLPEPLVANDAKHPRIITFSFISGPKGRYVWNCEFPCGQSVAGFGGAMSAYGFMSGYVNVV